MALIRTPVCELSLAYERVDGVDGLAVDHHVRITNAAHLHNRCAGQIVQFSFQSTQDRVRRARLNLHPRGCVPAAVDLIRSTPKQLSQHAHLRSLMTFAPSRKNATHAAFISVAVKASCP